MANSKKVLDAIEKAKEKLINMSAEEFKEIWDEFEKNYVPDPVFNEWISQAFGLDKLDED